MTTISRSTVEFWEAMIQAARLKKHAVLVPEDDVFEAAVEHGWQPSRQALEILAIEEFDQTLQECPEIRSAVRLPTDNQQ
jgi:hypothetical protein